MHVLSAGDETAERPARDRRLRSDDGREPAQAEDRARAAGAVGGDLVIEREPHRTNPRRP